jgi:hypothetical protein
VAQDLTACHYVFDTALLTSCKNKTSLPSFNEHDLLKQEYKMLFQLNFMAVALLEEISICSRCLSYSANKE